jgi:hypothetical protein
MAKTWEGSSADIRYGDATPSGTGEYLASDTVDALVGDNGYSIPSRGLMLAVAGAVKIITANGQTITFASGELTAGVVYPFMVTRVFATGTDTIAKVYLLY